MTGENESFVRAVRAMEERAAESAGARIAALSEQFRQRHAQRSVASTVFTGRRCGQTSDHSPHAWAKGDTIYLCNPKKEERVKRSDLTTDEVMNAIRQHNRQAWERLTDIYPEKVVLAAFEREVDAGRLEYGVSLKRPWIVEENE